MDISLPHKNRCPTAPWKESVVSELDLSPPTTSEKVRRELLPYPGVIDFLVPLRYLSHGGDVPCQLYSLFHPKFTKMMGGYAG